MEHVGGLYAVPGGSFCGPTAFAAITGVPTATVEQKLVEIRKRDGIPRKRLVLKGAVVRTMWGSEVDALADALDWQAKLLPDGRNITLLRWLDQRGHPDEPYLVLLTGHFVAVRGDVLVDTQCRFGIPVRHYQFARKRVLRAWKMEKL